MKKIFLCCSAGMSTSMVVKKMKQVSDAKGIETDIIAVSMEEFDSTIQSYDCCLLEPQIKYKLNEFKSKADSFNKPIDVINQMDYGMMNGEKILNHALKLIESAQ